MHGLFQGYDRDMTCLPSFRSVGSNEYEFYLYAGLLLEFTNLFRILGTCNVHMYVLFCHKNKMYIHY